MGTPFRRASRPLRPLVVAAVLVVEALTAGSGSAEICESADSTAPAAVRERLGAFQDWLTGTGLAGRLELLGVRCARHPQPELSRMLYRLEVRWLTKAATREAGLAELADFDAAFRERNGQSLRQRLFLKFAHSVDVARTQVSVHLHVLDAELAMFVGSDGQFFERDGALRLVVAKGAIVIPPQATAPQLGRPAVAQLEAGRWPDGETVLKILEAYCASRGRFRRQESEAYFVAFVVEHLKGEVFIGTGYWERLDGTLQFLPEPTGVRLLLHLDGRFAPGGLGGRPPDDQSFRDMEPLHTQRLETYARELLARIKDRMADALR